MKCSDYTWGDRVALIVPVGDLPVGTPGVIRGFTTGGLAFLTHGTGKSLVVGPDDVRQLTLKEIEALK